MKQPRPEAVKNSEFIRALDGLVPPTQITDPQHVGQRGPGGVTEGGGASFLGFQDQARTRLPKDLDLLTVIFIPRVRI